MLLVACVIIWLLWVGILVMIFKLDKPPHNKKITKRWLLAAVLAVIMQLLLTYLYNEYPFELGSSIVAIGFLIAVILAFCQVFFGK